MTFIENLNWRQAIKKFDGTKISDEQLQKVLHAIKMAPSSFGTQPYHVVVVSNKDMMQKLKAYAPHNEAKFDTAGHMLVFCGRTDIVDRFNCILDIQKRPRNSYEPIPFMLNYFTWAVSPFIFGRWITGELWAKNQAYIALGFALAACAELKIDSSPMEGFNARHFAKILNLPSHIKPTALLALGMRATDEILFERARFPESDLFSFK
jgi:nitroreductase / dihydropteridine reductase